MRFQSTLLAMKSAAAFLAGMSLLGTSACVSTICGNAGPCEISDLKGKRLVRYHLGLVREITPAVSDPEKQIYAKSTQTVGLWFDVDARPAHEDARGVGLGLGYAKARRDIFPVDCTFIVRVEDADAVQPVVEMFKEANLEGNNLCVISDH